MKVLVSKGVTTVMTKLKMLKNNCVIYMFSLLILFGCQQSVAAASPLDEKEAAPTLGNDTKQIETKTADEREMKDGVTETEEGDDENEAEIEFSEAENSDKAVIEATEDGENKVEENEMEEVEEAKHDQEGDVQDFSSGYFEVTESNVTVYDNESGQLVAVGTLENGEVYPIIGDYGNWHVIQFHEKHGFVWKEATRPSNGETLHNESDRKELDTVSSIVAARDTVVYDNSSGSLVPFATILTGTHAPVLSDYGNWWRVEVANRIGYVHKNSVTVKYEADDRYFKVLSDHTPVYSKGKGKIIGELLKGQVYVRVGDYGPNWHEISVGNESGYVYKAGTMPADGKELNNEYSGDHPQAGENRYLALRDVQVSEKTSDGRLIPFGVMKEGMTYSIVDEYGQNWFQVQFAGRTGYVYRPYFLALDPPASEEIDPIVEAYAEGYTSEAFQALKEHSFFMKPMNWNYIQAAERMLEGKYSFPNFSAQPYDFGSQLPWNDETYPRSFQRVLHAHFFIYDLLEAYKETGYEPYIEKANDIIQDWIKENPYNPNKMAWHDEATARRLVTWVYFFHEARRVLPASELNALFAQMKNHAKLLASDSFYTEKHNHGMFQDDALIVFGHYFDKMDESVRYRELAEQRLAAYFDYIVSNDGVHLEHSPGYGQLVANTMLKYTRFYESLTGTPFANEQARHVFAEKYRAMANYGTHVIKPDGTFPLLGDTFVKDVPIASLWTDDPGYQYAVSAGARGVAPQKTNVVFPDAGYAIFRDSWEKKEKGTYIHFTASYHSKSHKHADDLSVWLYAGGDVITEAGPNGYEYTDPFTSYGYSSYAHNTLLVDGEGLPTSDGKFESTYIKDYRLDEHHPQVTAVNNRYEGVSHERTLAYDKSAKRVSIRDAIQGKARHHYTLLWNLAPDITPVRNEKSGTIDLYRGNDHVLSIRISATAQLAVRFEKGAKQPMLGWRLGRSNGGGTPTYVIVVEAEGKEVDIATEFQIVD